MRDDDDDMTRAGSDASESGRDGRDIESRRADARSRKLVAAENRMRVFAMRRAGASYRAIARETGLSVGRCHQIVDGELRVLSEQLAHSREHLRALEVERVDAVLVKLEGWLREGRKVEKRIGKHGTVEETVVVMKRPSVGYLFAYMRALERRAKLLGLDAPTQLEVSTPTPERALPDDALDTRIAELQATIAASDARRSDDERVH